MMHPQKLKTPKKLLAFETSGDVCSIAVMIDNEIIEKQLFLPKQHANVLLDWLTELLSATQLTLNEIDAICYSCGPGGFTSVRISAAMVQGIALALNIPIFAAPTLQVIAQGTYREYNVSKVMVIQDARMQQVYCGYYTLIDDTLMQPQLPDCLCPLQGIMLAPCSDNWCLVTNAMDIPEIKKLTQENVFEKVITDYIPKSYDVLCLARHSFGKGRPFRLEDTFPAYLGSETTWKKMKPF